MKINSKDYKHPQIRRVSAISPLILGNLIYFGSFYNKELDGQYMKYKPLVDQYTVYKSEVLNKSLDLLESQNKNN